MSVRRGSGAAALAGLAAAAMISGCADMAKPPRDAAAAPSRCADERFPVYFAAGSAALQPDSLTVVRAEARRTAGCRVDAVDVTGVAAPDAAGRIADPALTQKRADAVAAALASAGLPPPSFDVQVAGAPATPAGERTPLPRRTEVVLHVRPAA